MRASRTLCHFAVLSVVSYCLAVSASASELPDRNSTVEKIDALFSSAIAADVPGCSVGVIDNGELVLQRGYGLSNLEYSLPLTGNNVHRIASVSKQFTAMAVLLLAEEGRIDLQEDIRRYLPELTQYGAKVSVNAMLGHFSGMADYDYISDPDNNTPEGLNIKSAAGGPFRLGNEDYLTIDEFYEVVKRAPLRFPPNQRWEYSNLAYFLLSMLVEAVSGESLRNYADRKIFKPLGMSATFFSDLPTEIVRDRAAGYRKNEQGQFVTDMTNLFWVGDGGLHTTVADMFKWDQHFYEPVLGRNPKQLLKRFNTPNSDELKPKAGYYANGQLLSTVKDRVSFSHSGGWLGVNTFYQRFPKQRFSTVIFCNNVGIDVHELANKMNSIYFSE